MSASQCQERYERLLDEAARQSGIGIVAGGDDEKLETLRRNQLRPGYNESHPETKPARPDPIDMD